MIENQIKKNWLRNGIEINWLKIVFKIPFIINFRFIFNPWCVNKSFTISEFPSFIAAYNGILCDYK